MDQVKIDNKFFSSLFFPAFTLPKAPTYPLHKKFWTKMNEDLPMVVVLVKVLLVYLLYRVVKRIARCLAPDLFCGICWTDVIGNMFKCRQSSSSDNSERSRCPLRDCPF